VLVSAEAEAAGQGRRGGGGGRCGGPGGGEPPPAAALSRSWLRVFVLGVAFEWLDERVLSVRSPSRPWPWVICDLRGSVAAVGGSVAAADGGVCRRGGIWSSLFGFFGGSICPSESESVTQFLLPPRLLVLGELTADSFGDW
jgi:hypothetical protein